MEATGETFDRQRRPNATTFSAQHPMIPKLYVMPWRQDMRNQHLLMQNAALAGITVDPHRESLCLCARERLSSTPPSPSSSSSSSSSSSLLDQSHLSSHFSRYNSSALTILRLFQN